MTVKKIKKLVEAKDTAEKRMAKHSLAHEGPNGIITETRT